LNIFLFTISDVDISDIEVFPGKEAGLGIFFTFFEANAYYTQRTSEKTQFVEACLYWTICGLMGTTPIPLGLFSRVAVGHKKYVFLF
jgi:hypothetical protein